MRHFPLTIVSLLVVLALSTLRAQATSFSQNGNVIVSDDFENGTVGSPPVAEVGTWGPEDSTLEQPVGVVTNAAVPGPAQGSQYFSMVSPANANPVTGLYSLSTGGYNDSGPLYQNFNYGDQIKFDSGVYIPTNGSSKNFPWQFVFWDGYDSYNANNRLLSFWSNANGTWGADNVSNFAAPSNLKYGVWQHWVLNYTVGAADATLTIDGVSSPIPASNTSLVNGNGTPGWLGLISNFPGYGMYLDAAPTGPPPNPGDVNLDGQVNQLDLNIVNSHFLQNGQTRATGDLNGDGQVNQLDLNLVNGNWLGTGGTGSLAAVPEPAAGMLLLIGGFGLWFVKHKGLSKG